MEVRETGSGSGHEGDDRRKPRVSPLRQRMIQDMELAGLTPATTDRKFDFPMGVE